MQQPKKSPIWVIFLTVMVDMLGVGILIPVMPLLLTDQSYQYHLPLEVHTGYIVLGFLTAIYPFMLFLATPVLGQISDHVGRKKVLALSIAGTAVSYAIFAIGIVFKNIPILFASRALDGITGGNIAVAQAAIADVTSHENRARNFGLIGAAFGIGFIVGPFLGGVLSDPSIVSWFNATTPFWFAAVLSTLNMFSVMFFFRETLHERVTAKIHMAQAFINIKAAALSHRFRTFFTSSFLYLFGFSFFTTFMGVFLLQRLGFNQGSIGGYFAFVGILVALTQGLITGFLAKRYSNVQVVSVTLFVLAVTFLSISFIHVTWALYLITIPQAICIGLTMANLTALISRNAGAHEQGKMLGINASVQALGQAIPPVIAGYLAANTSAAAPLVAASIFVLLAAIVFVTSVRSKLGTTSAT